MRRWYTAPTQPIPVLQTADEKPRRVIYAVEDGKVRAYQVRNPVGFVNQQAPSEPEA